jgi:unsaturated rhamnogalacturonyl hydrolase
MATGLFDTFPVWNQIFLKINQYRFEKTFRAPLERNSCFMKTRIVVTLLCSLFLSTTAFAQPEFTPDSVKSVCKRVAKGRLNSKQGNFWMPGTYYEGVMALYYMTKEKQYLDSVVAWGNYHKWLSSDNDTFPTNYDAMCCFQAYLESYLADPTTANLPHAQAALSYIKKYTYQTCPNKCGDAAWPIVDMYHMAGPSYPRAALILKDSVIYDSISNFSVQNAKHHYNIKVHLYNSNCSDTSAKAIAARQWWGRGCGWGVCATCRIHEYLPPKHKGRAWFEQNIRETSAKLITLQNQTDGMWRSELFTPTMQKEASGTSFFCYQLWYGLNNCILDTATYLKAAKKAWTGLIGCVGVDPKNPNLPGYSQGVGGGPSDAFGVTNHDEYTEGAFLMAGNELYKFLTNPPLCPIVSAGPSQSSVIGASASQRIMTSRFTLGTRRLAIPAKARGVEFYTPAGRKIVAMKFTTTVNELPLPETMTNAGVIIAKFIYK